MRPVALPTFEALGGVVARAVAIIVDHVEDVSFCPLLRHRVFIVRTVDIQVVVYAHVDVVVPSMEPVCNRREKREEKQLQVTFVELTSATAMSQNDAHAPQGTSKRHSALLHGCVEIYNHQLSVFWLQ